ncbi:MAG: NAD-binding protein [Pirellulaceae bacterium]|nr:NAD-binding protein [Pirellulaceae bacterium]
MILSQFQRRLGTGLFWGAVAGTLVFGFIGNHQDDIGRNIPNGWPAWYVADVSYRTLQLFILQLTPRKFPAPVMLEIARWLGALVAGIAIVRAAFEIFKQQLSDRRLRQMKGHVIVCGLGRKGFHLVKQLREHGDQVVVIEIDERDDELTTARAMGVPILVGDATSAILLRRAGLARASRLIAVCRDDSINIEIALQGREVAVASRRERAGPLLCHVHIIDLKLAELFRQHKIFSCTTDPFEARIFSFYENSARDFLMRNPLDPPTTPESAAPGVHLVIVGFGQMGESVALQAARIGHFAGGKKLRITVLDPEATAKRLNLLSRYPQIEQVVELEFVPHSIEQPEVRKKLESWATRDDERLVVAICLDCDPRALSIALHLPKALQAARTPIFVRQSEQRGLAALIDQRGGEAMGWNVTSFGEPEVSAGREQILQEKLDLLAQAIHARYVAQRLADQSRPSDGSTLPWPLLDAGYKSSCRQQADHIDVKLRAAGCGRIPIGEPDPPGTRPFEAFTQEEIERLARMEHNRWCADRYLAGWKHGPTDKPNKIHADLVPYEALSDSVQQYDRETVLQIPALLTLMGERIIRTG